MNLIVNKHFKFSVIWTNSMGKIKEFNTNCEDTALKMKLRRSGELYFRPRYLAELRLQRFYVYLFNNGKLCQDDVLFNLVTIVFPYFLNPLLLPCLLLLGENRAKF